VGIARRTRRIDIREYSADEKVAIAKAIDAVWRSSGCGINRGIPDRGLSEGGIFGSVRIETVNSTVN
jgi:hypothetical protein